MLKVPHTPKTEHACMQACTVVHGQWFSGLHLGLSSRGAIVTIAELRRAGMGVAYHMHFAHIVVTAPPFLTETVQCIMLYNNMYRCTAIDVFNTKG